MRGSGHRILIIKNKKLPLFIAFVLLAFCLFNGNRYLSFFSFTFYSLFTTLNGDILFFLFLELKEIHFLVTQIFLYIFLFICIAIIFNIIVVIVGDGYIAAKTYSKYDWIKEKEEYEEEVVKNISTFFSQNIEGEDPLEPFRSDSVVEERRKNRIRIILIKDKELHRLRFAQSLGIPVDQLPKKSALDETPIQALTKNHDSLSNKSKECLRTLNTLQKSIIKKTDDESDEDKEDYADRLNSCITKLHKRIQDIKYKVEVDRISHLNGGRPRVEETKEDPRTD